MPQAVVRAGRGRRSVGCLAGWRRGFAGLVGRGIISGAGAGAGVALRLGVGAAPACSPRDSVVSARSGCLCRAFSFAATRHQEKNPSDYLISRALTPI